jgi:hypothetical protein
MAIDNVHTVDVDAGLHAGNNVTCTADHHATNGGLKKLR